MKLAINWPKIRYTLKLYQYHAKIFLNYNQKMFMQKRDFISDSEDEDSIEYDFPPAV